MFFVLPQTAFCFDHLEDIPHSVPFFFVYCGPNFGLLKLISNMKATLLGRGGFNITCITGSEFPLY